MSNNNDLISYITQQLDRGVSEESIREALATNNWPNRLVDRAFAKADLSPPQAILPAPQDEQTKQKTSHKTPSMPTRETYADAYAWKVRWLRIVVVVIIALTLVILLVVGFRSLLHYSDKPSTDLQRKQDLTALASGLTTYYQANKTYPTPVTINSPRQASVKGSFNFVAYHDPSWNNKLTACTSGGRAVFTPYRVTGCYTYRATAMSGAPCDGLAIPCTHVVLLANLSNGKPYIVTLNQNAQDAY